jgi:hypothetical protein
MLVVLGAAFQAFYSGTGPIDTSPPADPGHNTIFAVSQFPSLFCTSDLSLPLLC